MKTLEQRFFPLFAPADVAAARSLAPARVSCPRVGQIQGTVAAADGDDHEVLLEVAAHRRGGMTLEARCTSPAGRVGRPCAALAAVFLEVDRRGLLAGIPDQTPVALDIVADDAKVAADAEPAVPASAAAVRLRACSTKSRRDTAMVGPPREKTTVRSSPSVPGSLPRPAAA